MGGLLVKRSSCLVLILAMGLAAAFVYVWPEESRRLVYKLSISRIIDLF